MKSFKIGIAGLGTVGSAVVRILQQDQALLTARVGRTIEIHSISARRRDFDRGFDAGSMRWCDNVVTEMAGENELDLIVELIGGADGTAYALVKKALENGISIVTANKALMAHHGAELARLAENNNADLRFEAAIAGAVPVVKTLREGSAANQVSDIFGILNGTCNYILSKMLETGGGFAEILTNAQQHGYAEADPAFDVDGVDAGHKLALLSALAFGHAPAFDRLPITGIREIEQIDILYAEELGYRVKLLGLARQTAQGIEQSVEPCLLPENQPLANIDGTLNAVYTYSNHAKETIMIGRGAGGTETASAVIADIIDVARGNRLPVFGVGSAGLKAADFVDMAALTAPVYMRLLIEDRSGVLADVTTILRDLNISVKSALQHAEIEKGIVPLILTLHPSPLRDIDAATRQIVSLDSVKRAPFIMRIID